MAGERLRRVARLERKLGSRPLNAMSLDELKAQAETLMARMPENIQKALAEFLARDDLPRANAYLSGLLAERGETRESW